MLLTSSEASKLLRNLNEQYEALKVMENNRMEFIAAVSENIEDVRPEYSYQDMKKQILEIERKIRVVKHAINKFNSTTEVPDFNMTIDMLLVYLPQLSYRKNKLDMMRQKMPKTRFTDYSNSAIIEYTYANYDINEIEKEYQETFAELSKAQNNLDVLNTTIKMELDL